MNKSEQINELAAALAKAQAQIKGALKDSKNPFFKSDYADLASCWEACRGPLTSHGLSVIQTFDSRVITEGTIHTALVTTLMHSSGQWIDSTVPIMPTKNDPQTFTATVTYLRRSSLSSIVGLAQIDDDGETAVGRKNYGSQIAPQQPTHEDGNINPTHYKITFGKFKSRTLEEVGADELRSYITYIENKAKKDGKDLVGDVADFIKRAEEYVGSFENQSFSDLPF